MKDEERMTRLIEETRKRAQKLQKIKEESEQGYLTRLQNKRKDELRNETLRALAAKHRADSDNKRKAIANALEKRKQEEKYNALKEEKAISKMKNDIRQAELNHRMALKRSVDHSKLSTKRKLEEMSLHRESSRRDFYESRVNLNQSTVAAKTSLILEQVRKESELIERLKQTRVVSDAAKQSLQSIIKESRLPLHKRVQLGSTTQ